MLLAALPAHTHRNNDLDSYSGVGNFQSSGAPATRNLKQKLRLAGLQGFAAQVGDLVDADDDR
jgi:hypothetical protein